MSCQRKQEHSKFMLLIFF